MVSIEDGLIISTLFPVQSQENIYAPYAPSYLDLSFLAEESISPTEISLESQNISQLYQELQSLGNDASIEGFRSYVQDLALGTAGTDITQTTMLWKDLSQNGAQDQLNALFENYNSLLLANEKDLANLMMSTAVETYEKLGYSSALDYINSVNNIFKQSGEDVPVSTLQDFISTWTQIKDLNVEDVLPQEYLSNFASLLGEQQSPADIQDVIYQYLTQLPNIF